MTTSLRSRKGVAIGVAALTLGISALSTAPALAAPGDGGSGSITVYKLEQGGNDLGPNDGSQLDTTGATPLVAGFTVCAIDGIDLTDASDWDRLAGITLTGGINGAAPAVTENGSNLSIACGPEQLTSLPSGSTQFADLAADTAYVVYESTLAADAVTAAQPTLLTVPYPGNGAAATNVWNYNPHIYPKNVIAGSGATKDAEIVGNRVTFDVNLPINPLAAGARYDEVRINDQLSASLTHTGGSVSLLAADGSAVALAAGTDYTLTAPTGAAGTEVVLNFAASGLALINQNIGGRIVLTINADATATGNTSNEAKITINGKTTEKGPEVVDPQNFFAGAHIAKVARNKGATAVVPLSGAQFAVYTAGENATDCPATPDDNATAVLSDQESGADGNTPDAILAEGKYCAYETLVPAGYKGLNGGILLDVTGEGASVEVVNTQIGTDPGDLPALPMTGGQGSVLLFVTGSTLLAAGLLLFVIRRRKAAAATAQARNDEI